MLLQQRDGPLQRLIAKVRGPPLQGGGEGRLQVFVPEGGAIASSLIYQVERIMRLLIARDPVVDAYPAGSEQAGDLGKGSARGSFQNSQSSSVETSIRGISELLFETVSLCRCQVKDGHKTPR
jgi:hypothetical protein